MENNSEHNIWLSRQDKKHMLIVKLTYGEGIDKIEMEITGIKLLKWKDSIKRVFMERKSHHNLMMDRNRENKIKCMMKRI